MDALAVIENRSYKLREIEEMKNRLGFDDLTVDLYQNIDFNDGKNKLILIQSDNNPMIGHYILVYKNSKNSIVYFDPSATKPLELWVKYKLDKQFQDPEKLYEYLKSGSKITYNDVNYQTKRSKLCGIMCLVRYYFRENTNTSFMKIIRKLKKEVNKTVEAGITDNVFIKIINTLLNK